MSYYGEKKREALIARFGEEAFPLLDAAGEFLREFDATPPGTVQQCCRSGCKQTRVMTVFAGRLEWSEMEVGGLTPCQPEQGRQLHDWRGLGKKDLY